MLTDVPYDLTPKFLEELLTKHKIDYVIHGDDPCILPGAARRSVYLLRGRRGGRWAAFAKRAPSVLLSPAAPRSGLPYVKCLQGLRCHAARSRHWLEHVLSADMMVRL